jgi:hypothetical protein
MYSRERRQPWVSFLGMSATDRADRAREVEAGNAFLHRSDHLILVGGDVFLWKGFEADIDQNTTLQELSALGSIVWFCLGGQGDTLYALNQDRRDEVRRVYQDGDQIHDARENVIIIGHNKPQDSKKTLYTRVEVRDGRRFVPIWGDKKTALKSGSVVKDNQPTRTHHRNGDSQSPESALVVPNGVPLVVRIHDGYSRDEYTFRVEVLESRLKVTPLAVERASRTSSAG